MTDDGSDRSPRPGAAPDTMVGEARNVHVLLLIERAPNRKQLASWLSARYEVEVSPGPDESVEEALDRCDLCVVDSASFRRYREQLAASKETAAPVFRPYLLVFTDGRRGDFGKDHWQVIDDVVETPIRQSELRGRIETLLRARRYSVQLKRQNLQLERFAGIVSHDLRNPINVAQGFLDLTRETGDLSHLDRIERALDRMHDIVEDVLTLTRTGGVETTEQVSLGPLVETAWNTVPTREATLELDPDVEQVVVSCDRSLVVELFENLFRNAVEHAGSDVTIRVGLLEDGFYVADDGPGIPEGERGEVFDYGYTTADGTGFGLAIVGQIVDAHGWEIDVAESESGGARFEIIDLEFVEK